MALIFLDGFETYGTAGIPLRWAAATIWQVNATAGRRGGGCLTTTALGSQSVVQRSFPAAATVVVGFAIKFPLLGTAGSFLRFYDGATMDVELRVTATGTIDVYSSNTKIATGAIALTANVYHVLEFKFTVAASIAANSCVVRVDGVTDAVAPAASSTKVGANSSVNMLEFFTLAFSVAMSIDDLYVLDGTGSRLNDFLGDKKVEAVLPTADGGQSSWTATGASNDWDCVNDAAADGDATYVSSNTPGDYDTYALADLAAGATAIDAIQVSMTARKDDAGARSITSALVVGGHTYDGAAAVLVEDYLVYSQAWEQNPDTAANWTQSDVNALEAGVKLVS